MSVFQDMDLQKKLKRSVTSKGTGTRTNEVITIAWCTLNSIAYVLMIGDSYFFIN